MMMFRKANNLSLSLSNVSQAFFMKLTPISSARIFSKTQNSQVSSQQFSESKSTNVENNNITKEPYPFTNPKVADKKYFWCTCGISQTQPFCNGKHKGTEFKPVKFTLDDTVESVNLCGCKLTKNAPYCDEKSCKN